ncbi:hypothetical protein ACU686_07295 [Yinghuangia aomiensis]
MSAQERKYIPLADGVVTVSDAIADLLAADHRLPARPTVVCNAPTVAELASGTAEPVPDVRAAAGLGADVPLLVYAGMTAPERGLGTAVAALPDLPDVHLAMVTARNGYVDALVERATALGVGDRLHVLPYVAPDQVVAHLAAGTVGIVTSLHSPNYELSLPSKYYEYLNARLPLCGLRPAHRRRLHPRPRHRRSVLLAATPPRSPPRSARYSPTRRATPSCHDGDLPGPQHLGSTSPGAARPVRTAGVLMPTRADPARTPPGPAARMNWITGDSRIQKLALDMAERGSWDVVVAGGARAPRRAK